MVDGDVAVGLPILAPPSPVNGAWTNKRAFEQPIVRVYVFNENISCRSRPSDNACVHRANKKKVAVVVTAAILSVITPRGGGEEREREKERKQSRAKKNLFVKC